MIVRSKEVHFPLAAVWTGGREVAVRVDGKHPVAVAPPTVFRGTDPTIWSPEDFLVGAAASCLAVTFTGLAARAGLSYTNLGVDADGVCGTRDDGRFGFTRMLLHLEIETDADQAEVHELAVEAEETCLVSGSLDLPVDVQVDIRPSVYADV